MRFKLFYATSNWMFSVGVFGRRSLLDRSSLLRTMAKSTPDQSVPPRESNDSGNDHVSSRVSRVENGSATLDPDVARAKRKKPELITKQDESDVKKKQRSLRDYRQTSKSVETIASINKKPQPTKDKEKPQLVGPSPPRRRRDVSSPSPSPPRLFEDAQRMEDLSFLDFSQSNRKPEDYDDKMRPVNKPSGTSSQFQPSLGFMAQKLMEDRARNAINAQQFASMGSQDKMAAMEQGGRPVLPPCAVPQQPADQLMTFWMMEQMQKRFEDLQNKQKEFFENLTKSQNASNPAPPDIKDVAEEEEEMEVEEESPAAIWSGSKYDFKTESVTLSDASIEFWSSIIGIDERGQKELIFKKNWANPPKLNFFLGDDRFKPSKVNAEFPKYPPWQAKEEQDLCLNQKLSGASAASNCLAVDVIRGLIVDLHSAAVDFRGGEIEDPNEEGEKICNTVIKMLEEGVINSLIHSLRFSASCFGFNNLKRHNLALKMVTAEDAKKVLAESPPDGEWLFGKEVKNSVQKIRDSSLIGKAFVKNDYTKTTYGKSSFRGRNGGRGRGFKAPDYIPRGRRFKGRGFQYRDTRGRQDGEKDREKKDKKDG